MSGLGNILVEIMQKYAIKVLDSIISATSMHLQIPLLTADMEFVKTPKLELLLVELK